MEENDVMASKNIHICDSCESLVDENDVFIVILSKFHNLKTAAKPEKLRYYSDNVISREICKVCMSELVDKLQLAQSPAALVTKAFKNFELPKRQPSVAPTVCLHEWESTLIPHQFICINCGVKNV